MRLAPLFFTLVALAPAQDELVLQRGDPVTGLPGTTISSITAHGIASTGDWWATARYTAQAPDGSILVINGVTEFRYGDALSGGLTFLTGLGADFTAAGDVAVLCLAEDPTVLGFLHTLLWNGNVVATKGTPIVDAQGAPVGPIEQIEEFVIDGNDRILARVLVGPFQLPFEYSLVEIDPTAPAGSPATLLLGGSATYPDGTELASVERVDINARGDVMTSGKELTGPAATPLRGVRVNGVLRARTGEIEPVTGGTWDLEGFVFSATTVDFQLDAQGEVVVYGTIGQPGTQSSRVIVRAGTVIAQAGQAPPGSTVPLRQIDPYGMAALPDGRVFWSGFEQGSSSKILFLGSNRYLQQGDALLGSTVTALTQFSNVTIKPFAENGGFFLHRVHLADGRIGLLRRVLSIGRFGCPQQIANSSGSVARLQARGSDLAGGHELILAATDLPAGQLGLFAVGSAAGSLFPGGAQGRLCIGGSIGRFPKIFQASPQGTAELSVDTTALPTSPSSTVMPGETWHFQGWFRDNNPTATSNFTDSVLVTFR